MAIRDMVAACLRCPVWVLVISKILESTANAVAGKQGITVTSSPALLA